MLTGVGALQTVNGSAGARMAPGRRAAVSWRAPAALALLLVVLAAAIADGLAGERPSMAPAARSGDPSHEGLSSLPSALQGPVSAALGAGGPAYRVSASNGGFTAASPPQHLRLWFGRAGVSLSSGATHVGLSLRGVGYGASVRALGEPARRVRGNRVLYARAGLSEWYVNGPLGLEQGFVISRTPSGRTAGPLTLSMALSGNAHASLGSGAQSATLSRTGGPALRYGGLTATDAHGRVLHSWLQLDTGRLLLRVQTRNARYPLRIDPLVQQGRKLTGGGEIGGALFGDSVALSSDGNTALIGGPGDSGVGAAWVFTRSGSTWTQQGGKLTGSGASGDAEFGRSVALASDGNTALIGGPGDSGVGAAWVFTRSGSTWTQQGGKLIPGGAIGEADFGSSVALSSDGSTALIGGWGDSGDLGAAWVFTRSGSTWTQQGEKLTGAGVVGIPFFGKSVALSSDGNTALVGAPVDRDVGAAWVFTRSGSTWTQQGEKLTGTGERGEGWLGESVALSADGNTALMSGAGDNLRGGAAWSFTRSGSTWTQQGEKLTGSGERGEGYDGNTGGDFGSSVALSADGSTALVGGKYDNKFAGAAWVFVNQPTNPSSPAEYGRCMRVPRRRGVTLRGRYAGPGCTEPGASGRFEWYPGVASTGFRSKISTGVATLETVNGTKLRCKTETGTGEYTGTGLTTVGGVVLTFTGCERLGEKCSSSHAAPGEIATNQLEGVLGVTGLGETSLKNRIGLDLFPVGNTGFVMEFSCGATPVSVRGSLIVPVAANRMLLTSRLIYAASKGRQRPEGFVGEPKAVLEASFDLGPFEQMGLKLRATQTNEEMVEVNPAF